MKKREYVDVCNVYKIDHKTRLHLYTENWFCIIQTTTRRKSGKKFRTF